MNELLLVSNILLWVFCLVLGVFVFALARQIGVLYERVAPAGALAMNRQISAGMPAPEVGALNLAGETVQIGGKTSNGKSTLLFFLSPTCVVCKTLLPALRSIAASEKEHANIILASDGESDDHGSFVSDNRLQNFDYVVSEVVGRAYGVAKLPYAVLINPDGIIASMGLINSREHLESLFEAQELRVASIQEYLERKNASTAPQINRP
jgi:methylamine dehydrogenase accessory protein MauD